MATLIPVRMTLSGCALNGGNDSAKQDLVRACELVNARSASDETFIPNVAIEFFASAARANADYLPLVEAANLSLIPPFAYSNQPSLTAEILKARGLITGFCTPKLAK